MIVTDTGIASLLGLLDSFITTARAVFPGVTPGATAEQKAWLPHRSIGAVTMNAHHSRSQLSADQQRARVLALRGFSQARSGDFEAAREAFANAARIDETLDLRQVPSFWRLSRKAHDAAAAALYDAGRTQDAAALIADLRTRFRPTPMDSSDHF